MSGAFDQRCNHIAQRTQTLVDLGGLFQPITFGLGFVLALGTGQIHQIQFAHTDLGLSNKKSKEIIRKCDTKKSRSQVGSQYLVRCLLIRLCGFDFDHKQRVTARRRLIHESGTNTSVFVAAHHQRLNGVGVRHHINGQTCR